jgi:CheY-like chemotaxis protein
MSSSKAGTISALILLIDDNRLGLTARKHVLEELGYKTLIATSANVALEQFSKQNIDLVVTDYKMPEMSGIDLIQKIRAIKGDVPIILISGFVDVLGLDEQTTGADVVIMKSANEVSTLVRSVGRLLNRKPPKKTVHAARSPELKARRKAV